ncbi:hypothetical protein C8Q78DRAFT_123796 [Trametes maxima]|nr:hypothetical protein C8Q78DRAFT_123796 [Trametes maxima]
MPHRQDNRQRLYGNDSRHPEHPPQRLGQSHSRGQAYGDRSYRHYQYNHHNWQGPGLEKQADLRSLPDGHRARGPGSHTGQRTDSARHSQSSRRHGERRSRSRSPRRERSHSSRQRSTPDESIVSDYSPQDKHRADTSMSPTDTFDALSERHKARPYSSIWGSSYAEDERRSSRSDMDRRSTRPGDDRHATYTDERHRESHRSPSRSRSRSRHRSSHRSRESSKRRDPTPSSNRWRQ